MLEKTIEYFKDLSQIPRCSNNEWKIIEWIINWAKDNKFEFKKDKIWNLLVTVPATEGKESIETIVLQWHVDMVCVKSKESTHDFYNDSIEIIEKDWYLMANDTTLWADNGIWVSMAMASAFLWVHPKLELLFTIDEEQGMSGALALEKWFITWTKLINLDSEEQWEITVWSAAWLRQNIKSNFNQSTSKLQGYKFTFGWLKWGHSWLEIDKSKWNIIDIFFLFLDSLWEDFDLSFINSGVADNAIPKTLEAVIWLKNVNDLEKKIASFIKFYIDEFEEANLFISFEKINEKISSIWIDNSNKIKEAVLNARSWVYKMSDDIEWFVISSQNLWILNLSDWNFKMEILSRSSISTELDSIIEQNKKAFWSFTNIENKEPNPAWLECKNSELPKLVKKIYEQFTWKDVDLVWLHAGLECGAIINVMPEGSEAVSIWPNIYWAHTYKEKCEIKSVWVLCNVLESVLKSIW